jgi:hypothetical protein
MKRLAFFVATALALACAHESSAPSSGTGGSGSGASQLFTFHSTAGSYQVTVTPTDLTSPEYQVSRTSDGLRGRVGSRPISVKTEGNKITGALGNQPVNMNVTTEGSTTRIQGLWGGTISNLTVSPQELSGRIGRCSFSMQRAQSGAPGDYSGFSACQGQGQLPTGVHVPQDTSHPDAKTAAELALLLGR